MKADNPLLNALTNINEIKIFGDSLYDLTKLSDVGSGTLVRVEKISN